MHRTCEGPTQPCSDGLIPGRLCDDVLEWDILGAIPGMSEWNERMTDSDFARKIEADRIADQPGFEAYIKDYVAKAG